MCGLAGYINLSRSSFSVDEVLLNAMQETISHRGPNGYRTWIDQSHQLGLAHRRLSIIDLSDCAYQPMADKDNTVIVCFNGEIYNHLELRAELEALGHAYFSQSDTETILYAYKQWGIDCLNRLEGMFAFVLFDLRTNELYLIRDRIGIKPLYFSLQGGVLSFASEIKALWSLPWNERTINSTALSHYLTFMATPAPMTLYKGIYKLPAAMYAKVDAHRAITFHEWYNPLLGTTLAATESQMNDEHYCVDTIRSLLRGSIKSHMMSDVPYGVFLSGGIDSSLNVALMAELTDKVKTFNVSFSDGPEYAETYWARKVAALYNTQHHEIVISEKEAFEFFQKMVYHQDEPLGDCVCIPLYYVSKLLRDSGVTVVQVGEGSDEQFCGYSSYAQYVDFYHTYWNPSQRYLPAFARKTVSHLGARIWPERKDHVQALQNWADKKHLFWGGAIAFSQAFKKDFMHDTNSEFDPIIEQIYPGFDQHANSYAVVDYHLNKLYSIKPDADFLTSMIYLEFKHRLPELLLMRVDKMTMATSVEGRVPFLDHKLVEFTLRMPSHLKYKDGITKYILKKACEGILPNDVIYRKKMGFAAPTKRWFKEGDYFKPYFQDLMHSSSHSWNSYLNMNTIDALYKKNQQPNQDFSVKLWVLQNLMASQ